jgi:hypothetical protein
MSFPKLKEARVRRKAAESLVRLRKSAARRREADRVRGEGVEKRIAEVWGSALQLFHDVLLEARDLGQRVSRLSVKKPVSVRRAHHTLYGRSLLAASEILALLRTGHGHGALARWRTLFELAAFTEFLKDHGTDAAERFVDYYTVDLRKYLLAKWPALDGTGDGVPAETRKLFARLSAEREKLKGKYGAQFVGDLGWAALWFPQKKRITIQDIVDAVDLRSVKPEYKRASHYVHAGPHGALNHYRETARGLEILCAATDELISRPGRLSVVRAREYGNQSVMTPTAAGG